MDNEKKKANGKQASPTSSNNKKSSEEEEGSDEYSSDEDLEHFSKETLELASITRVMMQLINCLTFSLQLNNFMKTFGNIRRIERNGTYKSASLII